MKYYKVNLSSGDPVRIREDELRGVAEMIGRRHPAIVTSGGVFNSAFYVSITFDKKFMDEVVKDYLRHNGTFDESKMGHLGFGKFDELLGKMPARTKISNGSGAGANTGGGAGGDSRALPVTVTSGEIHVKEE